MVLDMKFKTIFWIFLFVPLYLVGQNQYDKELSKNRAMLKRLKAEIESIKEQIVKSRIEESSITQQISLIDKEVALISRSKGLLKRQSKIIENKISAANKQLKETRRRCDQLKKLHQKRLVYAYKYGRIRSLELILTSESLNQALIRYHYLKLIAEHDERNIQSIKKKKEEIEQIQTQLANDLSLKKTNLKEKQKEESSYLIRKSKKSALLKKLQWNKSLYKKQLALKEQEKEKINGFILAFERKRKSKKPGGEKEVYIDFDDFSKAKGKLPWPVKGKLLTKYGKHRDPRLKTYIKNTCIEIQSSLGTPVKSVFTGVVRMITYLPGYGNTIIIDHGKGYYTVYSHLDEIYVEKDDFIKTGQVLATVGDSGSLSGSKLHFEIYGGQKTYNPEKWLR